jgi:F0F1-type ATP synthase epsilon subunit
MIFSIMPKDSSRPHLHVKIQSPEGLIWEGEAESVSSENVLGKFDILPLHARFITIIQEKPIIARQGTEEKTFQFPRAVMFVHDDMVRIYIGL